MFERSWTEISLGTIRNNFEIYRGNLSDVNLCIMPVVKADAYGHGDVEVAKVLQDAGAKEFAVSNIEEAIRLRCNGISGMILILGYTPVSMAKELFEFRITQTILSKEYAEELSKSANGLRLQCQFAVDTGMNRIGIDGDHPQICSQIIRQFSDEFDITGIFTHLCVADSLDKEDMSFTRSQIQKFKAVAEQLSDMQLKYIHCMNSAGGIYATPTFGNMVRLGIILYGLKPNRRNVLPNGICPALQWKSVISMIKDVHIGEYVGYGRTFCAPYDMRVATVTTGYADGYSRALSNKGHVLIDGVQAKIIGTICMDQFMIDVTNIKNIYIGKEVILLGKSGDAELTADEMAEQVGTIGYEVVCSISKRVPRKFNS
ncbi:MAG: alanine racemase [Oscillospiraceae bacterium]|nr:alanine racemase [Oscillospiraceae bacterium]